MTDTPNLPALTLAQHFARESDALVGTDQLSAEEAVSLIRRSLDRTAARYAQSTQDPALQKAGQWLVEIVKSGAGLIDRAGQPEVIWEDVATKPGFSISLRPSLFYGGALLLGAAGFVQGVGLAFWGALGLAGLHAASTLDLSRLPFMPKPTQQTLGDGRTLRASAVLHLEPAAVIHQVSDALKTADHILLRLQTGAPDTHWSDEPRLMALIQSLLEAGRSEDDAFALELARRELPTLIEGAGLKQVDYSKAHADWFDRLPAMGDGPKFETAAPAIINAEGRVIRRGTVWVR